MTKMSPKPGKVICTDSKNTEVLNVYFSRIYSHVNMSLIMRKPAFCICENKATDQLRDNREADQRLCFRYIDSTILLLS